MTARRILHVITDLDRGGAESMLTALLLAGRRDGAATADPEVAVVSLMAGGVHRARLEAAGIPVADLGLRRGQRSATALLRLSALMQRWRPDVVQSWMYHADLAAAWALWLSGRRGRTRLYWGVRCSNMDPSAYGAGFRRTLRLAARFSRMPDAVVVNSEAGRAAHLALGYRPRRTVVIPNGIDLARFRPDGAARAAVRRELGIAGSAPVLISVARVDPMKDHGTLLAALDRLDGVTALAVGAGTEGLPDRPGLRRLGARDDVPALLAAADVVVSHSAFGEGFSNALAEGMACGLPAVATDVGDAARIVGEAGRIVPPGDPAALAAAVDGILATPERRSALGARARRRIEAEFSLDRAVAAFAALHGEGGA